MTDRADERAIWIQRETQANTDPTSGDAGASALPVDAVDLELPEDMTEALEYQLKTGRPRVTRSVPGASGAEITFKYAFKGKSAFPAVGTNMSTVALDFRSILHECAFQARRTSVSRQVAAGAAANSLPVTGGTFVQTDLIFIWALNSLSQNRGRWVRNAGNVSPYSVHPALEIPLPTVADVAYGTEMFDPPAGGVQGATDTIVFRFGPVTWVMSGGRVVDYKIKGDARGIAMVEVKMMFNSWIASARAALPRHTPSTLPELVMMNSIVAIDNTQFETAGFEFDAGIKSSRVKAMGQPQGTSLIENVSYEPTFAFFPLQNAAFAADAVAKTIRSVMVMIGSGAQAGGANNCGALWIEGAQTLKAGNISDEGILRQKVEYKVVDHVSASSPTNPTYFTLGVA